MTLRELRQVAMKTAALGFILGAPGWLLLAVAWVHQRREGRR
jgi:hypothetical protein